MTQSDLGIYGLGVMGRNLALNAADHKHRITVYARSIHSDVNQEFVASHDHITAASSLESLVASLSKPRRILLMIKAGQATDDAITALLPLLEKDDILIDGGNSHFHDSERRQKQCQENKVSFIGMGISGGEEGARNGASIMPGGAQKAWEAVRPIIMDIAAVVDNQPCCTYIGPGGAGHFVKMVHNGIEYAEMQLIAEMYHFMSVILEMSAEGISDVFFAWNEGPLKAYLIDATANVLRAHDPETSRSVVDIILDSAGQKGTGKWTVESALDIGTAIPTIASANFARFLSTRVEERKEAATMINGPTSNSLDREGLINALEYALYAGKITTYAQGFAMLAEGSKHYHYQLDLSQIARIWKGGCIIQGQLLDDIQQLFHEHPETPNLLLDVTFSTRLMQIQNDWRRIITTAIQMGLPMPALTSTLAYFDSYRLQRLPANIIQGLRDYFGAHGFERVDQDGDHHHDWNQKR